MIPRTTMKSMIQKSTWKWNSTKCSSNPQDVRKNKTEMKNSMTGKINKMMDLALIYQYTLKTDSVNIPSNRDWKSL